MAGNSLARRAPRLENRRRADAWLIDELAHAGPEHLDAGFLAGYDRKQGYPDPGEDLAEFEAHGLGPSSRIVDLGAGTGQFAIPAARRFGHVTAVDISPAMVAVLRGKAGAAGAGNLDCVRGFEIASVSFDRRLYGAYACVKTPR